MRAVVRLQDVWVLLEAHVERRRLDEKSFAFVGVCIFPCSSG